MIQHDAKVHGQTMTDNKNRADSTVKDVAEEFGVHKNTVYDWVKERDVPHYRVGRVLRFDLSEVREWLQAGKAA